MLCIAAKNWRLSALYDPRWTITKQLSPAAHKPQTCQSTKETKYAPGQTILQFLWEIWLVNCEDYLIPCMIQFKFKAHAKVLWERRYGIKDKTELDFS